MRGKVKQNRAPITQEKERPLWYVRDKYATFSQIKCRLDKEELQQYTPPDFINNQLLLDNCQVLTMVLSNACIHVCTWWCHIPWISNALHYSVFIPV